MDERIFSLETEYAVTHRPAPGAEKASSRVLVGIIGQALAERYGLPGCQFLCNGSRFYFDVGHAEWSLPECRSAREVAIYDKAADATLGALAAEAGPMLARLGYSGEMRVVKNNVDPHGSTYGCHENYMAESETLWLRYSEHLRLTVRYLVPFLVTRQILCGTGRVGLGPHREDGVGFQIMQRADFVTEIMTKDTRNGRAIINFGREKQSYSGERYRRLHLILADSNLSGWATFMKLGTTGLVLRMLEDLGFGDIPHLRDPVAALHAISRDPTCRVKVGLCDGSELTAVAIQRRYLEQAETFLSTRSASEEEQQILRTWRQALDLIEEDPANLLLQADWVTKKALLDKELAERRIRWSDVQPDSKELNALLRKDIEYHDLSPSHGWYRRLLGDRADTLVPADESLRAAEEPPGFTRARIRGALIASARRAGTRVRVDDWNRVEVAGRGLELTDPLTFHNGDAFRLLGGQE